MCSASSMSESVGIWLWTAENEDARKAFGAAGEML
jgi:hypothetical protein